ncbi:MAG TPA: PKD domain-containing protein [Telluria sp.]|jgi:probable HAF family extracellular repeat protein
MVKKHGSILRAWLFCLGGLSLAGVVQSAPDVAAASGGITYRVINLGNGDPIGAYINASGQVAFSVTPDRDSPARAVFYDGARFHDVGTLGGAFAYPTGLNNSGVVVGQSANSDNYVRSFIWSRARGILDIGTLAGNNESWLPSVNNKGVMAGYSTGPAFPYAHAYRWSYASGIEDLGAFTSGVDSVSQGNAINDAGLIAGTSSTAAFDYHAFAWTRAGGMVDIDTLGSHYSAPVAVGAKGQVAGNYFAVGGEGHVFIWTRAGGMRDIGTAGFDGAWMTAMSANGQITGVLTSVTDYAKAMTWTREGGLINLGTFGGDVSTAIAANNKGQVVGGASTLDDFHAFVWTARTGKIDLNRRLRNAPAGLILNAGIAISDNGAIVASSNAGLMLLVPVCGCAGTHTVGPINGAALVHAGTPFDAAVSFTADQAGTGHHVIWSWGDGSGDQAGATRAHNGGGSASGNHTFTVPGIYTVTARVTDVAGRSVAVSRDIAVHDAASGATIGSGAFMSPHLPGKQGRFQAGKAHFVFLAPSAKANVRGQLRFHVGTFNFRSSSLQPAGEGGQYGGVGTVNGKSGYQFRMGAATGRFSLKVWHIDALSKAQVVDYDNSGSNVGAAGSRIIEGKITTL